MKLFLLWLGLSLAGWAHPLDDSLIQIRQESQGWSGTWQAPRELFGSWDSNRDGVLDGRELASGWPAGALRVQAAGGEWIAVQPPTLVQQSPRRLEFAIEFPTREALTGLEVSLFLPQKPEQQCLWILIPAGGDTLTKLLTPASPRASFTLSPGKISLWGSFGLGLRHILEGHDHLLFLTSLVVVGGGLWAWVRVITAFSLAHSLTLGLAALGWLRPHAQAVECTIALSVSLAALVSSNKLREAPGLAAQPSWQLAGLFGLVHGVGFAGALADLKLQGPVLLWSLLGFNLGVEVGQLGVALGLFPLFYFFRPWMRRSVCLLCFAAGLIWFGQRVTGG